MNYILEQKYKPNIDAGGMPPNKGMIMDYLYDNPQVFKNNLLARGLLTIPARVPSLYIAFIKWDAPSRWSLSLYHVEFGPNGHREDAPHFNIDQIASTLETSQVRFDT